MTTSPYFFSEPSNIFHKSNEIVVHFFMNRMALTGKEPAGRAAGGCAKSPKKLRKSLWVLAIQASGGDF